MGDLAGRGAWAKSGEVLGGEEEGCLSSWPAPPTVQPRIQRIPPSRAGQYRHTTDTYSTLGARTGRFHPGADPTWFPSRMLRQRVGLQNGVHAKRGRVRHTRRGVSGSRNDTRLTVPLLSFSLSWSTTSRLSLPSGTDSDSSSLTAGSVMWPQQVGRWAGERTSSKASRTPRSCFAEHSASSTSEMRPRVS